jgi:ribose 5-phosphate isomerase B
MKVLAIDVGGADVKVSTNGRRDQLKIPSEPELTAPRMVTAVKNATTDCGTKPRSPPLAAVDTTTDNRQSKHTNMKIVIGSDHAGFLLKQELAQTVRAAGHELVDVGTTSTAAVDYPDFAEAVARAVLDGRADRGVLICGSGVGASVAANKIVGIRAAVCHDTYSAHQGVEHDDMNVLVLGSRVIGPALAHELVRSYLGAAFTREERHVRRLEKVKALERRRAPSP